jgi:hypothetical protein
MQGHSHAPGSEAKEDITDKTNSDVKSAVARLMDMSPGIFSKGMEILQLVSIRATFPLCRFEQGG